MKFTLLFVLLTAVAFAACQKGEDPFQYQTEQFADLRILRYKVPGFEDLSLQQKKLVYYLYEAALSGRDILYDQNYKHNLLVRRTLEAIVNTYPGDRTTDDWRKFMVYTKRVWFSNGIHHHYSTSKFVPQFSEAYFAELVSKSDAAAFPLTDGMSPEALVEKLKPILFDPGFDAKRVNQDPGVDLAVRSANNYYEGVTQREVEAYYDKMNDQDDPTPISYGLNSKMVRDEDGTIIERKWKVGGMYSAAIERIVYWLEEASTVAENEQQKKALELLIEFYKTGDLETFDEYCIAWVNDTESRVDVINGFIEVYGDPMGYRGSYESVVSIRDREASKRIAAIGDEAQWFEDHAPLMAQHKKEDVTGISAKVITVVVEAGDTSPSSPIGINLPNANWIRAQHGSKSVSLGNIINAYSEASKTSGSLEEFAASEEEIELEREYGTLADNLHTDMHEVIGHASGKLEPGVGTPKETLKNYASTLEEARADLVALYFIMDQRLIELGVMPTLDVGKVSYNQYIRNGLLQQLRRIEPGENLEQAHMRNRQLVSKWVYERGKDDNVIEKNVKDGKTYFLINDYFKLRELFGKLLREIQRIKSQGDFPAGKALVETYGVKVDPQLHAEVLERYEKLDIAPYAGFINPRLTPVTEDGEITEVEIAYPDDFAEQMLYYAEKYSFLPVYN